jgi:hypothetical protein
MFAGHIKALGGPHEARGPDVAQAWYILSYKSRNFGHFRPDVAKLVLTYKILHSKLLNFDIFF